MVANLFIRAHVVIFHSVPAPGISQASVYGIAVCRKRIMMLQNILGFLRVTSCRNK